MEQKTVFISYRRTQSRHLGRSVYQDLKSNGYDVFFDVESIDNGQFNQIILNQIAARAHFILIISDGSLERCINPGDWVLREIEEALRLKRNIVPILDEGANLDKEMSYLPIHLADFLRAQNMLPLNHFYFEDGMNKLRRRYLRQAFTAQIIPTPISEQSTIQNFIATADAEVKTETAPPPKPSRLPILRIFALIGVLGLALIFGLLLLNPQQATVQPTDTSQPSVILIDTLSPRQLALGTRIFELSNTPTRQPTRTPTFTLTIDQPATVNAELTALQAEAITAAALLWTATPTPVLPTLTPTPSRPIINPNDPTCRAVPTTNVNFRSGPGTNYATITQLGINDVIPVVGRLSNNSWYQLNHFGVIGWVGGGFVSLYGRECTTIPIQTESN